MEAREARRYTMSNPPHNPFADRRLFGYSYRKLSDNFDTSAPGQYQTTAYGYEGQRRNSFSEGIKPKIDLAKSAGCPSPPPRRISEGIEPKIDLAKSASCPSPPPRRISEGNIFT